MQLKDIRLTCISACPVFRQDLSCARTFTSINSYLLISKTDVLVASKAKSQTCTPNAKFLEERLPIKKNHNKTQQSGAKTNRRDILFQGDTETVFDFRKTCFLIVADLIRHAQFCLAFNVWRSKVSKGIGIDCLKLPSLFYITYLVYNF